MNLKRAVNHEVHGERGVKTMRCVGSGKHLLGGLKKSARLPFLRVPRVLSGFELRFLG